MAEFIFALISLLALFALAMNRASLGAWALTVAVLTFGAQMGLASVRAAVYVAMANLAGISDDEFVEERRRHLDELVARAEEIVNGM